MVGVRLAKALGMTVEEFVDNIADSEEPEPKKASRSHTASCRHLQASFRAAGVARNLFAWMEPYHGARAATSRPLVP
jgi:hypothetical protein